MVFPPSKISFTESGEKDLSAAPACRAWDGVTPWNRVNARLKLSGES